MNLYGSICHSGPGNLVKETAQEFEDLVNQTLAKLKDKKPDIQWDVASAGNSNTITTFCALITSTQNDLGNYKTKIFVSSTGGHSKLELELKIFLNNLIDKNPKITLKLTSAGHNASIKTFLIVFVEYLVVE